MIYLKAFFSDVKLFANNIFIGNRTVTLLKIGSDTGVSCEFCKVFDNTFVTEHLRATASDSSKRWLDA